jgi:signal transduction histidine kinase
MDSETAERACDPFFSGREAGRGIGLGLPKALRLVEANGGSLGISSQPGQGTRCTLTLPLADPMR